MSQAMTAWSSGQLVAASQQLGKRLQEALVLLAGSVRHAQRAGVPQRRAAAHEHAALLEPAHDLVLLVLLAEVKPAEVRLRLRRLKAQRAQALVHRDAPGDRARDAIGDRVP